MNQTLLVLAILGATPLASAAPAPVYKERPSLESAHRALPKALRDEKELVQSELPDLVERHRRSSKLARTQKEKEDYPHTAERCKEAHYTYPIHYLEYQRKQPAYQSLEDQRKIEVALKFYGVQYEEAKRKGAFKLPD